MCIVMGLSSGEVYESSMKSHLQTASLVYSIVQYSSPAVNLRPVQFPTQPVSECLFIMQGSNSEMLQTESTQTLGPL